MKKLINIVIITILVTAPLFLSAQAPEPPHPNTGNDPNAGGTTNSPVGTPIDGGLSILLALGLGYGAKKVHDIRKVK
jgi:hypothetical protein